jgi:uncharacterized protein YqcC (DUF446 family)
MAQIHEAAARRLSAIEAELQRVGYPSLPSAEAFESTQAFLGDRMHFTQWLAFVFIPRVRAIIGEQGEFPSRSQVGVRAMREFDGNDELTPLVTLLHQFDTLIEQGAGLRGPQGTEMLEKAAAAGDPRRVRELLDAGVLPTVTALTWATSSGDLETVTALLETGMDPGSRDVYGVTPVFFAAGAGNVGICAFLIDPEDAAPGCLGETRPLPGHVEILSLLIERGAALDEPFEAAGNYASARATPLIVAAAFGHEAAALELAARGARLEAVDTLGRTASDWAARIGHRELASRLSGR